MIGQNAAVFNIPGSEIALLGALLSDNIGHLVRGEPDKIQARDSTEENGAQNRQNSMEEEEGKEGEEQSTVVRVYRQAIDCIDNEDSQQKEGEDSDENHNDLKIQIPLPSDFTNKRVTRGSRTATAQEESPKNYSSTHIALRLPQPEKKSAITRTRSGREISSNNALRQTRGSIATTHQHQHQTRSSRIMPSSKEVAKPVVDDADERVYTGRLRTRKTGSRIKEYDSDDDADYGYLNELEKQSTERKKVKPEPTHATEQHPYESLKMQDSDTRGSGSNPEPESAGVRTRKSLRSSTLRAQEQTAAHIPTEQVESNPLEQNFSGVRTRSRLSKGPSLR